MVQCMWAKDKKCLVMMELTGEPVKCDGWKRACLGRYREIIDRRDRVPVQLKLGVRNGRA